MALASRGERGRVDLLISDVYDANEIPLAGEATASSFGKLARSLDQARSTFSREGPAVSPNTNPRPDASIRDHGLLAMDDPPRPEDLAAAIMGLVAENIALLSIAQASAAGVSRIVYGGSTLNENPRIIEIVRLLGAVMGFDAVVLPSSGHAGALGAMLMSS
jgi:pantothenate kinase